MDNLIKRYQEKYGYRPSIQELKDLWSQGELSLTDKEEELLINA